MRENLNIPYYPLVRLFFPRNPSVEKQLCSPVNSRMYRVTVLFTISKKAAPSGEERGRGATQRAHPFPLLIESTWRAIFNGHPHRDTAYGGGCVSYNGSHNSVTSWSRVLIRIIDRTRAEPPPVPKFFLPRIFRARLQSHGMHLHSRDVALISVIGFK